jgi:hypothetical protein
MEKSNKRVYNSYSIPTKTADFITCIDFIWEIINAKKLPMQFDEKNKKV